MVLVGDSGSSVRNSTRVPCEQENHRKSSQEFYRPLTENCMHVEKILGRTYKTGEGKRLENRLKFECTPRVIQIKWAAGIEDLWA